jgi:hypothetical protein
VGTHPSKVQGKREHKWTQTKEKTKTINPKKKEKERDKDPKQRGHMATK